MSNVTSISEAHKPRSWNRTRWDWVHQLTLEPELTASTKLLAFVLVSRFAHHESGECSPGAETLASAMATSPDTVKRSLRSLEEAGWISRSAARGRGRYVTISFHFPEPEKGGSAAPLSQTKGGRDAPLYDAEKGASLHGKGCTGAFSPRPPNKDKPNYNQKGAPERTPAPGQTRAPRVVASQEHRGPAPPAPSPPRHVEAVEVGSWQAVAWNEWLAAHGYPPLSLLGRWIDPAEKRAWGMPRRVPPDPGDPNATAAAIRFADWLSTLSRPTA